jgi:signal transduction histidine kinase/ligand-binding sensor domain-containing protein
MSWTVRDGAPTYVQMITQSDDGFLWFATGTGVVRFDGMQFERYATPGGQSLPEASVRSLYALPDGGLLIGWFWGGATLLHDGRITNYTEHEGYPPGTTYAFVRDDAGNIWAAVSSALARFDGTRWHRVGADWGFHGRAIAISLDRDGTLAAFTDDTLLTLKKGEKKFQPTGGSSTTRVPIAQMPDGTLYLSDLRGIRSIASYRDYDQLNRPSIVKVSAPRDTIQVLADRDGSLWFASDQGVGRIGRPGRASADVEYFSVPEGLSDASADYLFEDREGSVWVATPSGVDRFRASAFIAPAGLLKTSFPAMIPDVDGGLWYAGLGHDLRQVARDGTVRAVAQLRATCAWRDPEGTPWFGSQPLAPRTAELLRLDGDALESVPLPPEVPPGVDIQAIAKTPDETLWVSIIRMGVYRRAGGQWTRAHELVDEGRRAATAMMTDSEGRLWLTYAENHVARRDAGGVRLFSAAEGLDIGNVLVIREKGDHLWVAGERGVAVLDGARFHSMRTAGRNVLRGITGLVESDDGDLWLHGLDGAILLRRHEIREALEKPGYVMTYRLFTHEDGLLGSPTEVRPLPTLVQGSDGRLWFATKRGPYLLDPREVVANSKPPSVIIKAVMTGAGARLAPRDVELPPLTTRLEFDYTTTSLAAARQVLFRYRLEGVDAGWQEAGRRRQAFYTNLGPGRYRFQVIAANEDGVWNANGASVSIRIVPAWFQTPWFYALCAMAIVAVLLLFYRARMRQVRARVQGRLQERLLERERIARELHDTLIQSFQGLVLTFSAAIRRIPGEESARSQMEKALLMADEALAEGRDRVRDLRSPMSLHGDLVAALREAVEDLQHLHSRTVIDFSVRGTPRALHPVVLEEAYRIAREALTNALRHAKAAGVNIEVVFGAAQFRIHVRDDGAGIQADVLSSGGVSGHWGLVGMRERAQKLGARLLIRSGAGSGTDVELDIPAAVAYREDTVVRWWRRWIP